MKVGYIDQYGEYHQDSSQRVLEAEASQYKSWSIDRQRMEHQWELLQPYDRNGKPNSNFMEAYPDESKRNHMNWEDRYE